MPIDNSNASGPASEQKAAERGRINQQTGESFEVRVAELYRLLRYTVEHGRLFSGRQVDLYLTQTLGDLRIVRAVECKAGAVGVDDVDIFLNKLRLVRKESPGAHGSIVSGTSFTDSVHAHAAAEGIQLTLFRDLEAQLLDGAAYATALRDEHASHAQYQLDHYIEPEIAYELGGEGHHALHVINSWLGNTSWCQLTLLGDVGTGKTFLTRYLAHRLACDYLRDPFTAPLCVRIDLRLADREFSLEGLIIDHFAKNGMGHVSFDTFRYLLMQGRIILFLDGFDEMSARVTPRITRRNFDELARAVQGRAKVLLTCRTHYFRSRTEEEEVILGTSDAHGSESTRELYWDLIARTGFRIAYLRPFATAQIEAYVRRMRPMDPEKALAKIRSIYNLMELCQRPLLLDMIVKSLDKLDKRDISAAALYQVYTDAWIHRDQWREVLSPDDKLQFLMGLARSLWTEQATHIHYNALGTFVRAGLATRIQDAREFLEIDMEVRTATFLTREDDEHYGFAHKSYREFFFARYLHRELRDSAVECLDVPVVTPEVCRFVSELLADDSQEAADKVDNTLAQLLQNPYRAHLSENALLLLYHLRRGQLADSDRTKRLIVSLPTACQLSGAQLDGISIEGAQLEGADLRGITLKGAILNDITCIAANLQGANMERASLIRARFSKCDCTAVTFCAADLDESNFAETGLASADFTNSHIGAATCEAAVLKGSRLSDQQVGLQEQTEALRTGRLEDALRPLRRKSVALFDDQFYAEVQRIALRYATRYKDDPDEIASDVMLAAFIAWQQGKVNDRDSLRSMVKFAAFERAGRRRRSEVSESVAWEKWRVNLSDMADASPGPSEQAELGDIGSEVRLAMRKLPKEIREVAEQVIDGCGYSEIAEARGCSRSTVYRLWQAALEEMRRLLGA